MSNTEKYALGDILQLKTDPNYKRIIIHIYHSSFSKISKTDNNKEVYYYTKIVDDDKYSPTIMKESSIDMYYTKIMNKIEIESI